MLKKLLILLLTVSNCYAANEIRTYYFSSCTVYATIRNSSGQAFDTTNNAFEAWNVMTDYDISLTDKDGGMFVGDFDTDVSAGSYSIIIFHQLGDNPSDNDLPIAYEEGYWTGSAWRSTPADVTSLETDWNDGGRLDLIIDAIKKYTDLIVIVETDVNEPNDADTFTVTDSDDVNNVDNTYVGNLIMVQDANDSHWETRIITDWDTDLTVETDEVFSFTPAENDLAYIINIYLSNIYQRVQRIGNTTNIIDTTGSGGSPGLGATYYDSMGDDP